MKSTPEWHTQTPLLRVILICSIIIALVSASVLIYTLYPLYPLYPLFQAPRTQTSSHFIASVDTMKLSRDTVHVPLSPSEIATVVNLSASIHTNYITVDTSWNFPNYMQQWINAIRASGNLVWFRIHASQWENNDGYTGLMTPAAYEQAEQQFILSHASFFRSGDILDPCPEPEQGHYWAAHYGPQWTYHAPNAATRAYNAFLRDTTTVADHALHQQGIYGVITTIRSTNTFFPSSPGLLEQATVALLGRITIDSYPEQHTQNPALATAARVNELTTIENLWHLPIVIGELGYSNLVPVSDTTQNQVLQAELAAISHLNYVIGLNYWVGAGSANAGGYTYLFTHQADSWQVRPAASTLSLFFLRKRGK